MNGQAVKPDRRGRLKTSDGGWFKPPPDTPLFAAIPDVAPLVEHAHSTIEQLVFIFLRDPRNGAKKDEAGGYLLEGLPGGTREIAPSYGQLARRLRVPRSTLYRAIKGLIAKGSIEARAVYYADRDGGRRVRTIYYSPPFRNVLLKRRNIPGIVLTAAGHPVIFSRRRRFLTSDAEILSGRSKRFGATARLSFADALIAAAWQIDTTHAPAYPRREIARYRSPEPSVTHSQVPRGAQLAEMPATGQIDEKAVLERLLEAGVAANDKDAIDVTAAARAAAPGIPTEIICDLIDEIRTAKARLDQKKRDPRPICTAGWILSRMPSHAALWRVAERVRARDEAQVAALERESRLNQIAEAIASIARLKGADGRTVLEDLPDIVWYEKWLSGCDPAEIEQARSLLAAHRARQA